MSCKNKERNFDSFEFSLWASLEQRFLLFKRTPPFPITHRL
jgi:hypothetical protein